MQFIDLKSQYNLIKDDILKSIEDVLEHGQYIMGPEVSLLEEKLAEYVGVDYCISCSFGTDAILIALITLFIRGSISSYCDRRCLWKPKLYSNFLCSFTKTNHRSC